MGSQAPGWDAVTTPGDPGTTRAAALRTLDAASRPSGLLGRPGPASRSPTPRSRQLSRPHPGRSEPRTLECRGEGEENAVFLPAFSSSPSEVVPRAVLQGARGGPRVVAVQLRGRRAHLLARASALSPPPSRPPHPRARAASCDTGYQSGSSLPTQQRIALGYRGKQDRGGVCVWGCEYTATFLGCSLSPLESAA